MVEENGLVEVSGKEPGTTIEIDGTEYKLAPMTMGDLSDMQSRAIEIRRQDMKATLAELGDLLPDSDRLSFIQQSLGTGGWTEELLTPRLITYAFYLRLRPEYPDLTEDAAGKLITLEAIQQLRMEVEQLVGLDVLTGGDGSPPEAEPDREE